MATKNKTLKLLTRSHYLTIMSIEEKVEDWNWLFSTSLYSYYLFFYECNSHPCL